MANSREQTEGGQEVRRSERLALLARVNENRNVIQECSTSLTNLPRSNLSVNISPSTINTPMQMRTPNPTPTPQPESRRTPNSTSITPPPVPRRTPNPTPISSQEISGTTNLASSPIYVPPSLTPDEIFDHIMSPPQPDDINWAQGPFLPRKLHQRYRQLHNKPWVAMVEIWENTVVESWVYIGRKGGKEI